MQLIRYCHNNDHHQLKISYICVHQECSRRFLCSKCVLGNDHKHGGQRDQQYRHIMDNMEFFQWAKNNLTQLRCRQKQQKDDTLKLIDLIKQIMDEIQNLFSNVQNIIQYVEQCKIKPTNINQLENSLQHILKDGFSIDELGISSLIKIHEEQQDLINYNQLKDQADLIIKKALIIKEWRLSQIVNHQQLLSQKIIDAKYQIQQIDKSHVVRLIGGISNDAKYIISGGEDQLLKIWDYQTKLIKQHEFKNQFCSCKFTNDSTLLYVGSFESIYKFSVNDQFREIDKIDIHKDIINNIVCISNTIILTSSFDKFIIKTDVNKHQQLLKLQAHLNEINGLDYNNGLNIIASGSNDKSIKLWNGNDGSLMIHKINAHNNNQNIRQSLFIINNNQLISLDFVNNLILWDINYQTQQLEQIKIIMYCGQNISLVLQQQYIITTGQKFIKILSIQGQLIRQFDHELDIFWFSNPTQLDSMKAVLIQGVYKLQICKIEID